MRNVVGQTPRGEDFFPRTAIINRIYRRLEAGANIFMAAPRRVGKTSIMRAMEDQPKEGFHFVYIITESIHDVEDFYHKLLTGLLNSEAISKLAKKKETIRSLISDVAGNIQIKIPWLELGIQKEGERHSYQASFEKLLAQLDTGEDTIVIMIDEFPQTVENIREKHGAQIAEMFLRLNREQRQKCNSRIRFILTGSIGLPAVVKKLTSTSVINDLNVIEIPPLSEEEAQKLASSLLNAYKVRYDETVIPYLFQKLKWLIPFHIQLSAQELIDIYENNEQTLNQSNVDQAFSQLLNLRNDIYFEHYYSRLKEALSADQCEFALTLLSLIADKDALPQEAVHKMAAETLSEQDRESVLESLIYDGYLFFDTTRHHYRFQSALLQEWWNKKMPRK